jgi:tetratricopeptide (TPR) repeat protein
MSMELRVNLVVFAVLAVAWGALTAAKPVAAVVPGTPESAALAALEDRLATDPTDRNTARLLADAYLERGRPGLAVAALRAGDRSLLEDPAIAHRLAQAYERSGRLLDATATADLALARCARALGSSDASPVTPVPRFDCSERTYAALAMHRTALEHLVQWGVADPSRDARTPLAYSLALRSARLAAR